MRQRHRGHCWYGCGCGNQKPVNEVIHPVKENVVHCCTKEVVKQVHPSHTTVMHHHLVENQHVYPHSTSVKNTFSEANVFPGSSNMPGPGQGNQVGGAMQPNAPGMCMGHHHGMKNCNKCKKW